MPDQADKKKFDELNNQTNFNKFSIAENLQPVFRMYGRQYDRQKLLSQQGARIKNAEG